MIAKNEAASRQLPVAWGRDASADRQTTRPVSEGRMQAAVVIDPRTDDKDPYADVPCTD